MICYLLYLSRKLYSVIKVRSTIKIIHYLQMIMLFGFAYNIIIPSTTDIAECGNGEQTNNTQELQEVVREFFENLNEGELDEFGREVFGHGHPLQFNPAQGWHANTNVPENTNSHWGPVILYVITSAAIIFIIIYHREILDTLFNIGRDIVPEAIPNIIPRAPI